MSLHLAETIFGSCKHQNGLEAKRGYLLYNILAGGCQTLIGISRWKIGIKPSRRKCECDEIGTSVKEELER